MAMLSVSVVFAITYVSAYCWNSDVFVWFLKVEVVAG